MKDSYFKKETHKGYSGKHHGLKKKGGKFRKMQSTANERFKGIGFYMGREGPVLNNKTMERFGLFVPSKNGSDIKKCLM